MTGERWTYLGPEGTFTEQAAHSLVDRLAPVGGVELAPVGGVSEALGAVRSGAADAACVALESSVEGAVPLTQDELTHGQPLLITAEAYVPITFDLLVRPGTNLSEIMTVGALRRSRPANLMRPQLRPSPGRGTDWSAWSPISARSGMR